MAISLKQEPLYPSITKPGVFYFDSLDEQSWEIYTGIDGSEINRFTFAIGTWTELKAQNRSIKLLPNKDMDFISSGLTTTPSGAVKPTDPPPGWTENTEEAIEALGEFGDAKPPKDSRTMTGRFEAMFRHPYFINPHYAAFKRLLEDPERRAQMTQEQIEENEEYLAGLRKEGTDFSNPDGINNVAPFRPEYMISDNNADGSRGVVKEKYWSKYFGIATILTFGLRDNENKTLRKADIGFHHNATSASPELKLSVPGKGYWKADLSDIKLRKEKLKDVGIRDFFGGIGRAVGSVASVFLPGQVQNPGIDKYFEYNWKPNLHAFQKFTREGSYSEDFEWIWKRVAEGTGFNGSDFDWVQLPAILDKPQYETPENIFVGVPIASNEEPELLNGTANESLDGKELPVFHPPDTSNYVNTTAPMKLYFGVDLYQIDLREEFAGNKFKFHVLEWGDEDFKLSNEEILNSEFFALYSTDDGNFDKSQAKKLLQVIDNSKYYRSYGSTSYPQNETLNFYNHTYTDAGVYSIKTIIFRLNSSETALLQTIMINTNIVVNDAGESLQDFNIFGASDFNVLPLKTDINDREIIIGGISDKSKYVRSVKKIERDDLYGQQDYLEKRYNEKFLPLMSASIYGDHPGKLDLSATKIFTKPYDISYFTDPFTDDESRSRATDILIDNNECFFEMNPSDIDRGGVENTGRSNERAIVIGDYRLIKQQNRELRKEDSMKIPKIDTRRDNQAF